MLFSNLILPLFSTLFTPCPCQLFFSGSFFLSLTHIHTHTTPPHTPHNTHSTPPPIHTQYSSVSISHSVPHSTFSDVILFSLHSSLRFKSSHNILLCWGILACVCVCVCVCVYIHLKRKEVSYQFCFNEQIQSEREKEDCVKVKNRDWVNVCVCVSECASSCCNIEKALWRGLSVVTFELIIVGQTLYFICNCWTDVVFLTFVFVSHLFWKIKPKIIVLLFPKNKNENLTFNFIPDYILQEESDFYGLGPSRCRKGNRRMPMAVPIPKMELLNARRSGKNIA